MNLKSLVDAFRSDAQDLAEPFLWAKTDVLRWFNEAEEEASIRKRLIFDKTSSFTEMSVSVGDTVIPLDPSIFEIQYARLVNSAGKSFPLKQTDRVEQDRIYPDWRNTTDRPSAIIHDDVSLEFNRLLDDAYTLYLEVFRVPKNALSVNEDEPEINHKHHRMLVEWVKYRAYSVPDSDLFNANKAAEALRGFEDYFGPRPDAASHRNQQANRPHVNKACW